MASLPSLRDRSIRLLDPGAGAGMLSAAICERLLTSRTKHEIGLVAYETDVRLIPHLENTLSACKARLEENGHRASFQLYRKDFVERFSAQNSSCGEPFDVVIMNPPYAKAAGWLFPGWPNQYALFMATGARLLRPDGQMVSITPRSFCNGLYFRRFRRRFFGQMSPDHIHLFHSRTDTFVGEGVCQESVVLCSTKRENPRERITVSTSCGCEIQAGGRAVSSTTIQTPDDPDCVIHIPETPGDEALIRLIKGWPRTVAALGLKVSTGPVVMFRCRASVREKMDGQATVPLLCAHHIRPFKTVWPAGRGSKPLAFARGGESRKYLIPAANYVLLKRCTSKEERRRLVAACMTGADVPSASIALENHINYVYRPEGGLTIEEMYGLAALFNSRLLDRYFRTFSGNTQVNATEVRSLPMPELECIRSIGQQLLRQDEITLKAAERVVMEGLCVGDSVRNHLEAGDW